MISAPVVITDRNSRRYTTSVVRVEAWPACLVISSMITPRWSLSAVRKPQSLAILLSLLIRGPGESDFLDPKRA